MKKCCTCAKTKPESEFNKRSVAADRLEPSCRECVQKRHRNWIATNKEKAQLYETNRKPRPEDYDKERWAKKRRFSKYGLTPETYQELLTLQGDVCAICGIAPTHTYRVDHDHSCCDRDGSCGNCVRGLLCMRCNAGIGALDDDPARLRRAADYIESFSLGAQVPITPSGTQGLRRGI